MAQFNYLGSLQEKLKRYIYSDFTLDRVRKTFGLTISDKIDIFASVHEVECPTLLAEVLRENVPLALASNTKKSRSEMIIAPILIAVRKYLNNQISLFSDIDFTVDSAQGLNGNCDFIISRLPELLILNTPVVTIVEAQKENLNAGRGKQTLDLENDPSPDLAIEIDITSSSVNKLGIYSALGVTELWRYDGQNLKFYQLIEGQYVECKFSIAFPIVLISEISRFIEQSKSMGKITLLKSFHAWVRKKIN
ncbi:Endonuclease, Uma2 family [Nostoc flagelliforme CCNUN1]|uniref:Endonuclease, Uma2 family n=1 Tax=Nostoc flagelliforme CCNUN1 TaxID=2038116 RepID=A0A2K8SWD6_9NOSO|nr:Endonuclease, Uma2 family [Nostoc flagelliforme CCNUN1]